MLTTSITYMKEILPPPIFPDIPARFRIPGYSEMREDLKQVTSLRSLVHMAEEKALQGFSHVAHDELPGLNPMSEKVMKVLKNGDYEDAQLTLEDYGQLHRAKSLYHKIIRDVLGDIIQDPKSKVEMNEEQRIGLKHGLKIQNEVDDIDILWHAELVLGPNALEIKEKMKDNAFRDTVIGPYKEFIYGIVRKNQEKGDYEYLTYAQAYPEQISRIAGHIDAMTVELTPLAEKGNKEAQSLIKTHQLYKEHMLMEGNVKDGIAQQQEAKAREFHTSWTVDADQRKMSIDYLPPMEAYSAGNFVEWQHDLLVKVPEFAQMNADAADTKNFMISRLKNDRAFKKLTTLQNSIEILEATDSTVYLRLPSGTSLRFRSAASNVPNEPGVRLGHDRLPGKDTLNIPDMTDQRIVSISLANGSKINFDYETMEERDEIGKPLLDSVFGEERAVKIFGDTKRFIPLLISRFVAGHEDAHNILERTDTLEVMGIQLHMDLDEAKSDLASLYTCFTPDFLKLHERQDLAKALFAEELRGLSRWNERQTDRTHLNGNIMLIQLMMDTNILDFKDNEWTFDVSSEKKLKRLSQKAKIKLLELAQVYEATDPSIAKKKGEAYKKKYFETNSLSTDMLRLLYDAGIMEQKEYDEEMGKRPQLRLPKIGSLFRRSV